jgi:hypothetical protein
MTARSYAPLLLNGTMIKAVLWSLAREYYVDLPRNVHGLPSFGTRPSFEDIGFFDFVNTFGKKTTLPRSFDGRLQYNIMTKPSFSLSSAVLFRFFKSAKI